MGRRRSRFDFLDEEFGVPPGDEAPAAGAAPEAALENVEVGEAEGPRRGDGAGTGRAGGSAAGLGLGRRRRGRRASASSLRNDPGRVQVGAYVRRRVRRRVDLALADERVNPGGELLFSNLVDGLLERWLEDVGHGGRDGDGV